MLSQSNMIYVPKQFILESFKELKGHTFELIKDQIFYSDSKPKLETFQETIEEGKDLEIIRHLSLPYEHLESLKKQGKLYNQSISTFSKQAKDLTKYF